MTQLYIYNEFDFFHFNTEKKMRIRGKVCNKFLITIPCNTLFGNFHKEIGWILKKQKVLFRLKKTLLVHKLLWK